MLPNRQLGFEKNDRLRRLVPARMRITRALLGVCALLILVLFGTYHPVLAQATPASNPDLVARCGQDIVLVIDESGSFQGFDSTMRYGVRAMLDMLADTGSRVALVEFNLEARAPLGLAYLPVTSGAGGTLGPGGAFDLYLNNNYQPQGSTNWDAAFLKVEQINREQGVAPLVVFLTDGAPNAYVNQFGAILVGDAATSLAEAIPSANLVKAQGSHLFVVGIGAQPSDEAQIMAVSGAEQFPTNSLRAGRADYVMTNLSGLEATLRRIVFELCASSLSVIKRENTANGQGYILKAGQLFTATVGITENGQPENAYAWVEPVEGTAASVGTSQPVVTNLAGVARWQWVPGSQQAPQPWSARVTLTESPQPASTVATAICTRKALDSNGSFTVSTIALPNFPALLNIGSYELVTCDVRNAQLGITVSKKASPLIVPESGGDVSFTFDVSNQSTVPVRLTALIDSVFGNLHSQGDCVTGNFNVISAGDIYRCTVTKRLAGNAGTPHLNTVTATVTDANQNSANAQSSATVTFSDALPSVTLNRSATPDTVPEPGGAVVYALALTNNSAGETVTLTALADTLYGNVTIPNGSLSATTCALPQMLAIAGQAGATYSCTFTVNLSGAPGAVLDTLTATVNDDDGNSQQVAKEQLVTIVNAPPAASLSVNPTPPALLEPGGVVTFDIRIANDSTAEALTLSSLTDSRYGVLTTAGGAIATTTCTLPQTLAPAGQPNASYACSFTTLLTGPPGLYANTVRATVGDDDGGTLDLTRASEVEILDSPSSLLVTKRAARTSLAEPGGPMTFTVTVANTSPIDHVRVDQIVDDQFGNVSAACVPALPANLAPQQQVRCLFIRQITGAVGDRHVNEVIATGVDDDGKTLADRDQEIIEITDLPARLDIIQAANPSNLPEPGGTVNFTASVENISLVDDIRIDKVATNAINQTTAGINVTTCTPALPALLQPGDQLVCRFTKLFTGPVGARHTSAVVVTGVDDDQVPVQQSGYETVEIVDVPSAIRVTQLANPVSVPEAGGLVNFTVQVQNISGVDSVTLQQLENDRFGSLGNSCTPALPVTLTPGGIITCSFSRQISGNTGTLVSQRTTASGIDDDGNPVRDDVLVSLGITDTPSSIKVLQTTAPTSIREPGGTVLFTVEVENTSPVDTVSINSVIDNRFGDIGNSCTPALPARLAPRAKLFCRFTRTLTGAAGTTFATTVNATGVDDDGQLVADFDLGNLDITDVTPQLALNATATPNQALVTGSLVTFTVALANNGPEAITIDRLFSTQSDTLHGRGTCQLPQVLPIGGTYTCRFTEIISGARATYQAIITAEAIDDDGNRVQVADEADVFLVAVAPELVLTKRDQLVVDRFTSDQDRGKPSPGDTLGYEIVVRNQGNGPATAVILTDIVDANSQLVAGSVQTSKGTVLIGHNPGDTLVVLSLGDLAGGESATVTFSVTIIEGAGATLLRNQATLSQGITGTAVAGSDDPDTPFFGDPTDTVVVIPPTALPAEEEPSATQLPQRIFLPLINQ